MPEIKCERAAELQRAIDEALVSLRLIDESDCSIETLKHVRDAIEILHE